ncbi:MAG TPA: hypothetical protein VNK95_02155, partial [Caldilineaceae bacterium]|nr:hypothetical protein [Caldilineaceae bacterium]
MNMRRKGFVKTMLGLFAASTLVMSTGAAAIAQSALTANWTASITYQNIGQNDTPVTISFYQEGSTNPVVLGPAQLPASNPLKKGAATSYFVGNLTDPNFTSGNAVMSSNEQLAATVVQFSNDPGFRMRLLYNGFPDSKSSSQYLVATTLLNRFESTTVFSIQNAESQDIQATINFYDADAGGQLAGTVTHTIPRNSSKFIAMNDANDTGGLGGRTILNGSAIVTAKIANTNTDAKVVVAASEYFIAKPLASNFEGIPLSEAANTIYMATGLCRAFNNDSFYAIQNTSLTDNAQVTITYFDLNGNQKAQDGPRTIGPGQKYSANTCVVNGGVDMTGFSGSARITSNGAPIVAIGKVINSLQAGSEEKRDYRTAFLSERQGYQKLSLPFIRWANNDRFNAANNTGQFQRAFIAIQNVGQSAVNNVVVRYIDTDGNTVGTHTIPSIAPGAKANSNPETAGALGQQGMNPGEF